MFGAEPNESSCVTFSKDRMKDITSSGACCDDNSNGVLGEFELRGVNNCLLFNAVVNIST